MPVLVLGAGRDAFFTDHEIHRTAHAYATKAEIFPSMGHNVMLDAGWWAVADRVHTWIAETVVNQLSASSRSPLADPPAVDDDPSERVVMMCSEAVPWRCHR